MREAREKEKLMENKRKNIIIDTIVIIVIFSFIIAAFKENISSNNIEASALQAISTKDKIYALRKEIENNYGIKVIFGESSEVFASKANASILTDEYEIYYNMLQLEKSLSKYPSNICNGNSTSVILLGKFNNNNLALAAKNNLGEYTIYISDVTNFERAFHHEMYHIIEYMNNATKENIYSKWNLFNPQGFNYVTDIALLNGDYVYNYEENHDEIYFCTKYSKVSEKEDRAEIFADLMSKENISYLKNDINLAVKTSYIINMLNGMLNNNLGIQKNELYWNIAYNGGI